MDDIDGWRKRVVGNPCMQLVKMIMMIFMYRSIIQGRLTKQPKNSWRKFCGLEKEQQRIRRPGGDSLLMAVESLRHCVLSTLSWGGFYGSGRGRTSWIHFLHSGLTIYMVYGSGLPFTGGSLDTHTHTHTHTHTYIYVYIYCVYMFVIVEI